VFSVQCSVFSVPTWRRLLTAAARAAKSYFKFTHTVTKVAQKKGESSPPNVDPNWWRRNNNSPDFHNELSASQPINSPFFLLGLLCLPVCLSVWPSGRSAKLEQCANTKLWRRLELVSPILRASRDPF